MVLKGHPSWSLGLLVASLPHHDGTEFFPLSE